MTPASLADKNRPLKPNIVDITDTTYVTDITHITDTTHITNTTHITVITHITDITETQVNASSVRPPTHGTSEFKWKGPFRFVLTGWTDRTGTYCSIS